MNISRIRISEDNLDRLVNFLIQELRFDYENHSVDMTILASEDYYLRNTSAQLNMIILKKEESSVLIDIIGAGGGTGFFFTNFGSEKAFIKKAIKVIGRYCAANGIKVKEI